MNDDIIRSLNRRLDDVIDQGWKIIEDEELVDRVEELRDKTEVLIRKHPVKSVAGGLFIGYILGKIFSSDD